MTWDDPDTWIGDAGDTCAYRDLGVDQILSLFACMPQIWDVPLQPGRLFLAAP